MMYPLPYQNFHCWALVKFLKQRNFVTINLCTVFLKVGVVSYEMYP